MEAAGGQAILCQPVQRLERGQPAEVYCGLDRTGKRRKAGSHLLDGIVAHRDHHELGLWQGTVPRQRGGVEHVGGRSSRLGTASQHTGDRVPRPPHRQRNSRPGPAGPHHDGFGHLEFPPVRVTRYTTTVEVRELRPPRRPRRRRPLRAGIVATALGAAPPGAAPPPGTI